MDIMLNAARRRIPDRKLLVASKRDPIMYGARKPPISPKQRKTPLAEPRYSEGIPELSIRISRRIGVTDAPAAPKTMSGINLRTPEVMMIPPKAITTTKEDRASERALKRKGIMWGRYIVAGKPAMMYEEAAKPARLGDIPPVSNILGSQFIKP